MPQLCARHILCPPLITKRTNYAIDLPHVEHPEVIKDGIYIPKGNDPIALQVWCIYGCSMIVLKTTHSFKYLISVLQGLDTSNFLTTLKVSRAA